MSLWNPYFKIFDSIIITYKYFTLGFIYIYFKMLLGENIYTDLTTIYLNMFEVLSNVYPNFF